MKRIVSAALVGALWIGSALAAEQSAPVLTTHGPGAINFSPKLASVEIKETRAGRAMLWRYTLGLTRSALRTRGYYCPPVRQFVTVTKDRLAFGVSDASGKPLQVYSVARACLAPGHLCRLQKRTF
jgi:hypothetical protein